MAAVVSVGGVRTVRSGPQTVRTADSQSSTTSPADIKIGWLNLGC